MYGGWGRRWRCRFPGGFLFPTVVCAFCFVCVLCCTVCLLISFFRKMKLVVVWSGSWFTVNLKSGFSWFRIWLQKVLFHLCGFDSTVVARKCLMRSRSVLAVVVFNRTFRTVSSVIGCVVGWLCPSFVRYLDFDWIDLARNGALACWNF